MWTIKLMSRSACGIEMDDKFVVTGGYNSVEKVTEFTEAGAVKYMRNLKTGRYWHACSKFVNVDGDTVSSLISVEYIIMTTYNAHRHYWLLEVWMEVSIFLPRRSTLAQTGLTLHLYLLNEVQSQL